MWPKNGNRQQPAFGVVHRPCSKDSVPARHISRRRCALPVLACALPDLQAPSPNYIFKKMLLCFQTADVKMLVFADLCRCFHRSPTKLCPDLVSFVCWIVTEFWSFTCKSVLDLVVRALNCARFCVVCALNCAQILVFRALDCAQFLLHPALFPI